jgi:hypothetical protein
MFRSIARRELASSSPDPTWLDATLYGLVWCDDRESAELMLRIFERTDVPGWLRGNAGDKLGCVGRVSDRRTELFRRCRAAALKGLSEDSIDVQFWSMYLIGSLCSRSRTKRPVTDPAFRSALGPLAEIAKTDHRLGPGFWWPMSAEAEDIIICIKTGRRPEPNAAERWSGHAERGKMNDPGVSQTNKD